VATAKPFPGLAATAKPLTKRSTTRTTTTSPRLVRTAVIGPAPKHSRKWKKRRDAKVQRDAPRDPADALLDDFDLISKLDLDLFAAKVDALNAHLDSIYGKDQARPEEHRKSDEDARDRVLINNCCRVVSDILLHLRHHRTLRDLEQKRAGQRVESFNSCAPPQASNDSVADATPSERPASQLLAPQDFNISTPRQCTSRQETELQTAMTAIEISEEEVNLPDLHQHPASSFSSPARSNEVTPNTHAPSLDRAVEITEEDDDSVVDVTPSGRPESPSIMANIAKPPRAIRADFKSVAMNNSNAQEALDALNHELRDETQSEEANDAQSNNT
jgi:hypothetical protein